ncbi:hypothetical protein PEC18_27925 [Paucibacter sp. O1-1]|nr:hypothetical protein [Paucibacter sp. O1-1]MDA3829569.1 hypothetical protein [Paucibacter sp. O1-1]
MKSKLYVPSLLLSLMLLQAPAAQAQSTASEASALSTLPVAVSVAAPVMLLSAGVALTVVAVEASAQGSVWVLERASDGARASVRFAGQASAVLGTAVVITVIGSGYVLSAAGEAIAFVPNAIGTALLHNEQLTR